MRLFILLFLSFSLFPVFFLMYLGGEGVAVGAHRLYSHKAFKATFVVTLMLIIFHTMAGQVINVTYTVITIFYNINFEFCLRIVCTFGLETTDFIINTVIQMLTHITLTEASSSVIWVG